METENLPALLANVEDDGLPTISEVENAALKVLAEIDSNFRYSLKLKLRMGAVLCIAKDLLPHGDFGKWVEESLNRKESWCAAHMRLWRDRTVLDQALLWAAETGHPCSNCCSVDRVLKVIADWKKRDRAAVVAVPKPTKKSSEIIAELRREIADNMKDFIALRDPLPSEIEEIVIGLGSRAGADDGAARELAEIAQRFHWRLCDLMAVAQSCGARRNFEPRNGSALRI
jgi:hypothetical protein